MTGGISQTGTLHDVPVISKSKINISYMYIRSSPMCQYHKNVHRILIIIKVQKFTTSNMFVIFLRGCVKMSLTSIVFIIVGCRYW